MIIDIADPVYLYTPIITISIIVVYYVRTCGRHTVLLPMPRGIMARQCLSTG